MEAGVVHVDAVREILPTLRRATITRYPGAARSAFAWRGDMDLYDESTMQSVEGLEVTFGLAARYRMPQSMYVSSRLTFDVDAAKAWAAHYAVERGAEAIPRFIDWMNRKVQLQHRATYPFKGDKPYVIELGNHGHLHYGTDTAGAPENGWTPRSKIGAGRYPWLTEETSSFAEQRDNALETRRILKALFDFSPASWAMPDRTSDRFTPAAMAAAGCAVLSDSDIRTRHNVILQPPPHFASNTNAVELTKRYPGDPEGIQHYWMNMFWMHRAHRLGIPVIFMCHQHMRLFDGWAGTRLTEAILRRVLHGFSGDLWINTVYGIGVYWRDVLSEQKTVVVEVVDGGAVVRNRGTLAHTRIPVDLELDGGGVATILVDLEPGRSVEANARGVQ